MNRQLKTLLITTIFTAVTVTASGVWAARDVNSSLAVSVASTAKAVYLAPISADIQRQFVKYQKIPHIFGYRAFAVDPVGNNWGRGTQGGFVRTAITNAIAACNEQSSQQCELYAIGDIVVQGLADWKAQTALILYQVNRSATNSDLDLVSADEPSSETAALRLSIFFRAAEMGSVHALKAMLDRGVDIDAKSPVGSTALLYAASRGQYAVVAHLLEHGADVNARNNIGKTALGLASIAKNLAQQRNYRMADHNGVVDLFNKVGAVE